MLVCNGAQKKLIDLRWRHLKEASAAAVGSKSGWQIGTVQGAWVVVKASQWDLATRSTYCHCGCVWLVTGCKGANAVCQLPVMSDM